MFALADTLGAETEKWGASEIRSIRNPNLEIRYDANATTKRDDGKKSRPEVRAFVDLNRSGKLHAAMDAYVQKDKVIFSYFSFGNRATFSKEDVKETMLASIELLQATGKEIVVKPSNKKNTSQAEENEYVDFLFHADEVIQTLQPHRLILV